LIPAGVKVVFACTAPSPRAMPASTIAEAARAAGLEAVVADSVADALAAARRRLSADGRLVVTGTLYVVAEARPFLIPSSSQREVSDSLNNAGGHSFGE
jgi:folylpolyglutamate synthase/dihydropteroate synthase